MSADLQTIVIAWREKSRLVPTGKVVERDRNYFPEMELAWEGKACVWLNEGTPADLEKARAYAASEGHEVLTFPVDEPDPLGRARALILKTKEMLEE